MGSQFAGDFFFVRVKAANPVVFQPVVSAFSVGGAGFNQAAVEAVCSPVEKCSVFFINIYGFLLKLHIRFERDCSFNAGGIGSRQCSLIDGAKFFGVFAAGKNGGGGQ